ncbi:hypothetical protein [Xenorhabdus japonica]|uniref:Uncharacterized protein n=1 Tax=Xenorhabdus japonica TaxID=53341 RepID=A0A1I4ZHX6_9GAMM|nr:hypothetical protein [Xenorhabdus japonica]SFN49871.1 hypothetical protein SAMN05421579_10663 [Xenorhabdus japonica]
MASGTLQGEGKDPQIDEVKEVSDVVADKGKVKYTIERSDIGNIQREVPSPGRYRDIIWLAY